MRACVGGKRGHRRLAGSTWGIMGMPMTAEGCRVCRSHAAMGMPHGAATCPMGRPWEGRDVNFLGHAGRISRWWCRRIEETRTSRHVIACSKGTSLPGPHSMIPFYHAIGPYHSCGALSLCCRTRYNRKYRARRTQIPGPFDGQRVLWIPFTHTGKEDTESVQMS
jgi:hypothetical protein